MPRMCRSSAVRRRRRSSLCRRSATVGLPRVSCPRSWLISGCRVGPSTVLTLGPDPKVGSACHIECHTGDVAVVRVGEEEDRAGDLIRLREPSHR